MLRAGGLPEWVPQWTSTQRLQVGKQRLQVLRVHGIRRHAVAGLDSLRVRYPPGEVSNIVRQRSRRDSLATGKVRQVRADARASIRAAHGMTHHAGASGEYLLAAHCELIGWIRRGLELLLHPLLKFLWRFGDDEERHVRVLMSAELGALSAEAAFLVG